MLERLYLHRVEDPEVTFKILWLDTAREPQGTGVIEPIAVVWSPDVHGFTEKLGEVVRESRQGVKVESEKCLSGLFMGLRVRRRAP